MEKSSVQAHLPTTNQTLIKPFVETHTKPKNFNMFAKLFAVLLVVALAVAVASANPSPAAAPRPGVLAGYAGYPAVGYAAYPAYGGLIYG